MHLLVTLEDVATGKHATQHSDGEKTDRGDSETHTERLGRTERVRTDGIVDAGSQSLSSAS